MAKPSPRWSSTSCAARSDRVAVKAPGYGDRRKAMLEDIAILTGGRPSSKRSASSWNRSAGRTRPREEGRISTRITPRSSKAPARARHQGSHRPDPSRNLKTPPATTIAKSWKNALAKLAGGVAKVNVGAATESEMKEKKARVEDALHATRAAVEEGILPGGGVALLRAKQPEARRGSLARRSGGLQHRFRACRAPLTMISPTRARTAASSANGVGRQRATLATTH
jgi:chaperonin GroEL